eukprot:SM000099S25211  [mRNA]  locus=s99:250459:254019:+ [translate_table: standard]
MDAAAMAPDAAARGGRPEQGLKPRAEDGGGPATAAAPSGSQGVAEFRAVYDQLRADVLQDSASFRHTPESRAWVEKMLDYNVPGGKLNRGVSVVDSLQLLQGGAALSEENFFRAAALGWCIEWLQAFFLVMDDIMDNSITRRGQPCWYRVKQVELIAINDAILLNTHIFLILKKHFKALPYYVNLLDLFNEVTYQTASGQMLDLITTPAGEVDLTKYTMPTYLHIVQHKTAYYSFYLPVACALLMAGEEKSILFEAAKGILDDYLDCFGDPATIGKVMPHSASMPPAVELDLGVGTDIEDTKCSWLAVQALQRASVEQKQRFKVFALLRCPLYKKAIYGKPSPELVAEVKQMYKDLHLQEAFAQFEAESYEKLQHQICSQESPALQDVLQSFLAKIYKRRK